MFPLRVHIASPNDAIELRTRVRTACVVLGYSSGDLTLLMTVVSELARNILQHAGEGDITIVEVATDGRVGLEIAATDHGPGIPDVDLAMRTGYSSSGGPGLGLAAIRRGVDDLIIESANGNGTTVRATKWLRSPSRRRNGD